MPLLVPAEGMTLAWSLVPEVTQLLHQQNGVSEDVYQDQRSGLPGRVSNSV